MRRTLLFLALAAAAPSVALTLTPVAAEAKGRKPEDALRGRIILSTTPFPASFKDDATFISTMKRVDTKAFRFGEAEKIAVEIMAFFAKPVDRTELTATLYDTTERVEMKDTFPINPGQRGTRILASYFDLRKAALESERRYKLVITDGFRGPVLAETDFAIKE
jgi:hypothetical protein